MKKKIGWPLLTLVVFTCAVLKFTQSASSSPAGPMMLAPPLTFNVNSTADILVPPAGVVTLRSAIVAANADLSGNPSLINLTVAGTYTLTLTNANEENAAMSGDLDITTTNHSVTIAGMGTSGPNATIIDASGLNIGAMHDRAFHITGSGVTANFQDLVIQNGQATNDGTNGASTDPATANNGNRAGAGILNNGGTVTLTNVIVRSCQSIGRGDVAGAPAGSILEARGAGLASLGMTGMVMVTNSKLTGNTAQGGNGTNGANVNIASAARGGAIYFEGGTLNINGSRIDTSSAIGGNGQDSPPVDGGMTNGGNGGMAQGGGLWVGGGTVTINNTTFDTTAATGGNSGAGGNSSGVPAEADGGGIYSLGSVTVTNSTFHLNAATGGTAGNAAGTGALGSHTAGDGGAAKGGAIFADGGSLIVDTDTFANNSALGGNGGNGGQTDHSGIFDFGANGKGGIAQGGAITNNTATVNIHHSTISLNNAQGGNSGVPVAGVDKPVRPVAEGTGGGISVGPASVTLENTIIGGNTAANGTGDTTGAPTPGPDVDGAVTSNGHNLLTNTTNATGFTGTGDITGVSPMLSPLADNGGPTFTMALMAGSPAIDAGVAAGAMFDQRGKARTVDDPSVTDAPTSDETDIGAFERVPPCILTCPTDITMGNDPNKCGAVVTFTPAASAGCGTVTCVPASGSFFPAGTTPVTCTSAVGPTCNFKVTVNDTQAPTITISGQSITLWPPDHKYATIKIADLVASVSDNCDSSIGTGSVTISMVTSDEPDNSGGDGNTTDDIVIAGDCKSVQLRAERSGDGNGRVYTITLKVSDASGNVSTATAKVTVPKSQNGAPAIDDGPHYTVLSACP